MNSLLSALKAGKRVVLTGHSLGGSLALLLALDLLANHCAPDEGEKEEIVSSVEDYFDINDDMNGSDNGNDNDDNGHSNNEGVRLIKLME
jgi:esterase/lipase